MTDFKALKRQEEKMSRLQKTDVKAFNPFISTVPYSGRITSVCLTWTYEEGLPLFKEDVVEYFPSVVLEESTTTAKLFVSGYSVFKTSFSIYGLRH